MGFGMSVIYGEKLISSRITLVNECILKIIE